MVFRRALPWVAMALSALAVAWSLWPGAGDPAVSRPVAYTIADGTVRTYRVTWRSQAHLLLEAGDAAVGGWMAEGEGRIAFKYFAAGTGWDVAAQLDVTSRLDGAPAAIGPGIERPFSFHQDRRGYTSGFAFAPGLPEETRALVRQTVSRLQVALSARGAETWTTRERDGVGLFRAAYGWIPGDSLALRKQKLEYLADADADAGREVVRSEGSVRLLPGGAGVAEVLVQETVRAREEGVGSGVEALRFEARLVEGQAFGELARFADFVAERDRPFVAPAPAEPEFGPAPASREGALAIFGIAFDADRARAEAAVLAWLRSEAGAPAELMRWLDACSRGLESMDPARQAVLFRLLAQAGTPAALDALIAAAEAESFAPRTRRLAIGHMAAVSAAEARQVEALFQVAGTEEDASLRGMALLAAGALGHRELASDEVAGRVAAELGTRYGAARGAAERIELLGAMGNSGDPRLLPSIGSGLEDADPAVRAAAARALRRAEGDEAGTLLVRQYAEDPDPAVRAAVVETLGRRTPSDDLLAWARDEALRARDEGTRLALVDWLGESLGRAPENAAVLRQLLESEPGPRVERRVLRYVAPR